jgi:hypothetical protein
MSLSIDIAKEFSPTPGPRYEEEGEFSGEEFRKRYLVPTYEKARARNEKIVILLNGTEGYATSFLEEAFGGLARLYGDKEVLAALDFECDDDPFIISEIKSYIAEANDPKNRRKKP